MGTDIHIWTERKTDAGWECIDFYSLDPSYEKWPDECTEFMHEEIYKDRDYVLFGALAGVRGGHENQLEPKGFPSDASKQTKTDFEDWGCDAHSSSYLTLTELKTQTKELH